MVMVALFIKQKECDCFETYCLQSHQGFIQYFVVEATPAYASTFLPLVAESHGGWGEVAVAVVDRMARSLARQTGQREEEVMRQTWSRLQRSNGQQKTLTQVYVVIFVFTDSLH